MHISRTTLLWWTLLSNVMKIFQHFIYPKTYDSQYAMVLRIVMIWDVISYGSSSWPIFFERNALQALSVHVLLRPVRTPDFSPIEHVLGTIGRRLGLLFGLKMDWFRLRHEVSVPWNSIPEEYTSYITRSMPRRRMYSLQRTTTHY